MFSKCVTFIRNYSTASDEPKLPKMEKILLKYERKEFCEKLLNRNISSVNDSIFCTTSQKNPKKVCNKNVLLNFFYLLSLLNIMNRVILWVDQLFVNQTMVNTN